MESGRFGWENAATVKMMGAVSPAALPIPSTDPVIMPGSAWGNTTLIIVCHFVAPRASEACRYVSGTALSASSVVVMITGSIRKARVSEPARIDFPNLRKITKKPRPKRPYTTDGTPDILTTDSLIRRVNLFLPAYSFKYTAAKIPMGSEKTSVPMIR